MVLSSTENITLIRDGGKGVWRWGRLYTYRYTVTIRMNSALRWTAIRAILTFHNCEGQSHKTVSTDHYFRRERRAEADSNRGPSTYQPNALPLGQTGSHRNQLAFLRMTAHTGHQPVCRPHTAKSRTARSPLTVTVSVCNQAASSTGQGSENSTVQLHRKHRTGRVPTATKSKYLGLKANNNSRNKKVRIWV